MLRRRVSAVAGGGARGGAWPRCGAARSPSWRPRGSGFVPERCWSRSRFPGPATEEGPCCPRPIPTGGGWTPRRSSRDVTAWRWRQRLGPEEGVSRAETPRLRASEAPGPLPPSAASPPRSPESLSSLTALLQLWDPGGGLFLPDLGHPASGGVDQRRPRVRRPCRAPAASLSPSTLLSVRLPAPDLASEPPIQIPSLLSGGLPFPPGCSREPPMP